MPGNPTAPPSYILGGLLKSASARGARRLRREYHPTAKNSVVTHLCARLGFGQSDDGNWYRGTAEIHDADLVT